MTQPSLFKELDFNERNLYAWAIEQAKQEPFVEEQVDGETVQVPNTPRRVLQEVLMNHYGFNLSEYDRSDLIHEALDYIRNGVHRPVNQMTETELIVELCGEALENWDFKTMDEFLKLPIVTGEF